MKARAGGGGLCPLNLSAPQARPVTGAGPLERNVVFRNLDLGWRIERFDGSFEGLGPFIVAVYNPLVRGPAEGVVYPLIMFLLEAPAQRPDKVGARNGSELPELVEKVLKHVGPRVGVVGEESSLDGCGQLRFQYK